MKGEDVALWAAYIMGFSRGKAEETTQQGFCINLLHQSKEPSIYKYIYIQSYC